jgi:hypothetical protein
VRGVEAGQALFWGGIEPRTIVAFESSSFVPCPKASSVLLLIGSDWNVRLGAFAQSLFPVVLTTRFPSVLSNELPARFAPDAATKSAMKAAASRGLFQGATSDRAGDQMSMQAFALPFRFVVARSGSPS